jgi:hypothetical protein
MAGSTIAVLGDQNGDGRPDLAIGVPQASNNARDSSGSLYVLYGQPAPAVVSLANLGGAGYRIDGASDFDAAGTAVANAGDVSGDGIADILIGAPGVSETRNGAGAVYVLFGAPRTGTLDLGQLGASGFVISGARTTDATGAAVASAGDINGDAIPDFLIGAPGAGGVARPQSGSVFAVFAPPPGVTTEMDLSGLSDPGSNVQGYHADGGVPGDAAGSTIAGVGDQNGDGVPDMAIGMPSQARNGRQSSGVVYVVFGSKQASATPINLSKLGNKGYELNGAAALEGLGASVAGIGDLNKDGRADLLVGAPNAGNNGRAGSGSAYVFYGSAGAGVIDMASLGARGFRVDGATAGEGLGSSVASVGDVTADGLPDLLLGAPGAGNNAREGSGSAYVVPSPAAPTSLDMAAPLLGLLRIDGAAAGDNFGSSVAAAGDLTGDGVPEVVAGAPNASNGGLAGSGSLHAVSYRVAGAPPVATTSPAASVTATSAVLNGSLVSGALAASYRFDWGTTTAYGQQTPAATLAPSAAAQPVTATLSGLTAGTTYHYRLVATSPVATSTGADATFTTPAAVTGGTGGTGGLPGALKITRLRAVPTVFATRLPAACRVRVAPRSAAARRCAAARARLGTLIRFNLSGVGRVQLQFRRVGRARPIGVIGGRGVRGLNRYRFAGKVGRSVLANGRYSITFVAGTGAKASKPVKVLITVRNPLR